MSDASAEGRPARWLVVSYWANVEGAAPSFHIDDRLPHLRAAGAEVEVLTSVCGPRPAGWERRWHRVPSMNPSGVRFELRYLASRWPRPWGKMAKLLLSLPLLPLYWIEKLLLPVSSTTGWWLSAGLAGLRASGRRRPDLIYSTGGPPSAHLAAALISGARGLPWIAEIQDPLVYQGLGPGPRAQWLARWVERLIHRRATGVVYLTRTACERAQARHRGGAACLALYPGAEGTWPAAPARRDRVWLVHAGTLGGNRNPETLLAALRKLAKRRPELRRQFRLLLVGGSDKATRRMVRRFPYRMMVTQRDRLPRQGAWEAIARADVLLVLQNRDPVSQETIPSKTYEYLAAGRPILGLLHGNAELAALLRDAGHTAVEVEQEEAVREAVAGLHACWQEGRLTAARDGSYTCARAAAELVAWARARCQKKEGTA